MYTPPMFKSDRAASLAFAQTRGFGLVCASDGAKPIASSLPFYLTFADDGTPHAAFHVARHNPLVKLAGGSNSWLLAVNGADAYVSPDWYVSPDQVPTWLYQVVHLTGTVRYCPTTNSPSRSIRSAPSSRSGCCRRSRGCRRR